MNQGTKWEENEMEMSIEGVELQAEAEPQAEPQVGNGKRKREGRRISKEKRARRIADQENKVEEGTLGDGVELPESDLFSESGAEVSLGLEWGKVHEAILSAEIEDGSWGGKAMQDLAVRLWSTMEDLEEIRDNTNASLWATKRMERLIEVEQLKNRGLNWDRIEGATLDKLFALVAANRIHDVNQLLTIARAANLATRRGPNGDIMKNPASPNTLIQINQNNSAPNLPGPGSLGTITMNLSQRAVNQLNTPRKLIEGEVVKLSDSIEMLGVEEIQGIAKGVVKES